jgi:hypothetical protein
MQINLNELNIIRLALNHRASSFAEEMYLTDSKVWANSLKNKIDEILAVRAKIDDAISEQYCAQYEQQNAAISKVFAQTLEAKVSA